MAAQYRIFPDENSFAAIGNSPELSQHYVADVAIQ
jgi:hypothetical protein